MSACGAIAPPYVEPAVGVAITPEVPMPVTVAGVGTLSAEPVTVNDAPDPTVANVTVQPFCPERTRCCVDPLAEIENVCEIVRMSG